MKVGTILHHKYYNGVVEGDQAEKYKSSAYKYFRDFGMYGSGMFAMIAKGPNVETDYDWSNTDLLVEGTLKNGSGIHFNTVITGHLDVYPPWYKDLSPELKLTSLEAHVRAVVKRYKGRVSYFKLVNEVVRESDEKYLGTNLKKAALIAQIFKWAEDEHPEGRYMLNEYGCIISKEIRGTFLSLVDEVKALGGRIDIIGEQAHSGYNPRPFFLPTDEIIDSSLDEIHKRTNLPIMITEFDIGPVNGDYPGGSIDPNKFVECDGVIYSTWYEYQAYAYSHFKELCESKDYMEALFYWNFADDSSMTWERFGCGLLNEQLEPKHGMKTLLTELEKELKLEKEYQVKKV